MSRSHRVQDPSSASNLPGNSGLASPHRARRLFGLLALIVAVGSCQADDSKDGAAGSAGSEMDAGQEAALLDTLAESVDGSGAEDGSGGTGGGMFCNPAQQPASTECTDCVQEHTTGACKNEAKACDQSKDCVAIRTCAKDCPTFQCLHDCIELSKPGESVFINWRGCVDTGCHDACHCSECRLFQSTPCHECINANCASECLGCDKSAKCMAAMYCRYFHCLDPNLQECWDTCTQAYPGSDVLFSALLGTSGCIALHCSTECNKQ